MKSLIINADDLGYDPRVSAGILEAMRQGVVSSATLMVNTPFSQEAAREAGGLSLGLHFNLARFAPCWPSFPSGWLRADGTLDEQNVSRLPSEVVRDEARAQIRVFETLCQQLPTHIDVHKHLHTHRNVLDALIDVAAQNRLPLRALDAPMRARCQSQRVLCTEHFIGEASGPAYWTWAQFQKAIESLNDGTTELMCHPGYAPSRVTSSYSAQREVELATFVNPEARRLLNEHQVQVGSFSDLR